jgi:hypothetical protein
MLRKFLVKRFALYYHPNLFGKKGTILRAAPIIFSLLILTGIFKYIHEVIGINWIKYIEYSFLSLFALSIFIGFIYFDIYPIRKKELDKEQLEDYHEKKN